MSIPLSTKRDIMWVIGGKITMMIVVKEIGLLYVKAAQNNGT